MSPPIVASDEVDPRLTRIASAMWAICCEDRSEDAIALMVFEYQESLSQEDLLGVWELLDARQRSAWKAYLTHAKAMRAQLPVLRR